MILIAAAAPVAGGPSWTDILTAIGTVGAVIVAVGIALWTEWRSSRRLKAEHERSDRLLKEERERSDRQLAGERERSRAQIEEERRITREREQLAEAYAVQIISAGVIAEEAEERGDQWEPLMRPMAIMVNHGLYRVTGVDARFTDGETAYHLAGIGHLSALFRLPEELQRMTHGAIPMSDPSGVVSLTPQDPGLRLAGPVMPTGRSLFVYPVVRWSDRWGARWEHRCGEVRQVRDDEEWGS